MANWDLLKASIANVIRTNGNQEITGALLQSVLANIVSTVGQNATFVGLATQSTNPGAPDGPVFYLAGPGAYPNFSGLTVANDEAAFLHWNGSSWYKESVKLFGENLGTLRSWTLLKSKLDGLTAAGRYVGVYDAEGYYVHQFVLLVGEAGSGVYTQSMYSDFSAENLNAGNMAATGGAKVVSRVYSNGAWGNWKSDAETNKNAIARTSVDLGNFSSVSALMTALDALPGKSLNTAEAQRYHGVLTLGISSSPFTLYQCFFNAGMYVFQDLDTNYLLDTLLGGSTAVGQRQNFYRRGQLNIGNGYKWDAWAAETNTLETSIESIKADINSLKTSDENTAITLQQGVVKQFVMTTKVRIYRRIDIVNPKGWESYEGYAAWIHTRRQHYLLSSSSGLFSYTEGQLYELGTAYNDLAVGNGDIHIKMVVLGKYNTVRLYIAVEAYNYVQIETSGDVTFYGSTADEFDSVTPSVACRSLDVQAVTESLSSLADDVFAVSGDVSNLEEAIADTRSSLAGLISGVSDTVDDHYTELTDLSKTVDDNYMELDDRVFNNTTKIDELQPEVTSNSAAIQELQDAGYITATPGKTMTVQDLIPEVIDAAPDADSSDYNLGQDGLKRWNNAYVKTVNADTVNAPTVNAEVLGDAEKGKPVKVVGQDLLLAADGWIQCLQALRFGATYSSTDEPEFGISAYGDANLKSLSIGSHSLEHVLLQYQVSLIPDSGVTYNEETGYWSCNDITDITDNEMKEMVGLYASSLSDPFAFATTNIRTNIPMIAQLYSDHSLTKATPRLATKLQKLRYSNKYLARSYEEAIQLADYRSLRLAVGINTNFAQSSPVLAVENVLSLASQTSLFNINIIRKIFLLGLRYSLKSASEYLHYDSLRYMVEKAANTSAIQITVHADTYSYLTGTAEPTEEVGGTAEEWQALVTTATEKNITFATA